MFNIYHYNKHRYFFLKLMYFKINFNIVGRFYFKNSNVLFLKHIFKAIVELYYYGKYKKKILILNVIIHYDNEQ